MNFNCGKPKNYISLAHTEPKQQVKVTFSFLVVQELSACNNKIFFFFFFFWWGVVVMMNLEQLIPVSINSLIICTKSTQPHPSGAVKSKPHPLHE